MVEKVEIRYGAELEQQEIEERIIRDRQRAFASEVLRQSHVAQFALQEAPASHIGTLVHELLDSPPVAYDEAQLRATRAFLTTYDREATADREAAETFVAAETFSAVFQKHQASKVAQSLVHGTMPQRRVRTVIRNALEETAPDNRFYPQISKLGEPVDTLEQTLEKAVNSGAAKCVDADPEIFFPEKGASAVPAKQICEQCPVRDECLAYAVKTDQAFGVWGGLSTNAREQLRLSDVYAKSA